MSRQLASTCEVSMIYGYVLSLLKVLGCIQYTSLYNHHTQGSFYSTAQVSRLLHIKIHPSFSWCLCLSVSDSPSPLPSHRGGDCYQHSLSLSLYLGYSCYDNYYACQSVAVTHLYTLSVFRDVCAQSVLLLGDFVHVRHYNGTRVFGA